MDLDKFSWNKLKDSNTNSIVLDVRTNEEFEISCIPNAINLDFYNPKFFLSELKKMDKELNYFVYCRTGARSANSCSIMSELGFKNVFNLLGGIVEWEK